MAGEIYLENLGLAKKGPVVLAFRLSSDDNLHRFTNPKAIAVTLEEVAEIRSEPVTNLRAKLATGEKLNW